MADNLNNNAEVQIAVDKAMNEQKKKKKKKRLIILAVVFALIVIIGIAASSGSGDTSSTGDSGSSQQTVNAEKDETVEGKIGNYVCVVKSAKVCKNWSGDDSVKITYNFTNNGSEPESFDLALTDNVYQDGIGLESTFISSDDDDFGIDVKIKPGVTKEVAKVYKLNNKTSDLEIEIGQAFSFDDTKITTTVSIK